MTNLDNLSNAIRNATADGYVSDSEARQIQKYALKDVIQQISVAQKKQEFE